MSMKRLTLLLAGLAVAGAAFAQETPPQIDTSFEIGLFNKYVWRGVNLVNDPVLQPSLTFSTGRVKLNFWGNVDTKSDTGNVIGNTRSWRFSEVDSSLTYTGDWAKGAWTVGYINYNFPNNSNINSGEVFATLEMQGPFTTTLQVYRDVDLSDGLYVNLGANTTKTLTNGGRSMDFNYGASIGYGDRKFNAANYANGSAGLADWNLFGRLTFGAGRGTGYLHAQFTGLLDDDQLAGAPNRNNFVFGAGWAIKF